MKHLLLVGLLLTGLTSCKKDAPEATDPFLGHWQADTQRMVYYDIAGSVTSDTTDPIRQELDVTAMTIASTGVVQ
jgi:hypothetical protein